MSANPIVDPAQLERLRQLEGCGKYEHDFATWHAEDCDACLGIVVDGARADCRVYRADTRELAQRIAELHPPTTGAWQADRCPQWIEEIAALLNGWSRTVAAAVEEQTIERCASVALKDLGSMSYGGYLRALLPRQWSSTPEEAR